jgi:hypothetical protein
VVSQKLIGNDLNTLGLQSECVDVALAVGVVLGSLRGRRPLSRHEFVEAVGEGLVHIVVDSGLVVEARGLPELRDVASSVVVV